MSDTKVVITGISGVYPKCNNIAELAEKLYAKEDLIIDITDINFSIGKLNTVKKFDSGFFEITNEHAEYMDPMCRVLLEKTYEAVVDSGYNPQELRNSKTAVFVANCTSDAEVESTFRTDVKGALICERAQSFLANRISYCFGFIGPSGTVNTACSSSLYALDFAVKAIKNNECEAAIVGGSNLCLAPGMIHLYKNLGITSARCRSFDDTAVGFCRSEAISVIFLQKSEMARRLYAEIVHVKTNNDGYKKQSILFPSHVSQTRLINQVYQECGVEKSQIAWVEAHGTGTRVGDYQEMKSLETLCENRSTPLYAGCIKSNLGHTEAASGLCSIAKVIIAMERNKIPPNLHFNKPQTGIDVLYKNKIKVITDTISWDGGYVAINNFGIGGANAHLVIKSNTICRPKITRKIPTLVIFSGRTENSIEKFISYFKNTPLNIELVGLFHKIFSLDIPNHEYRGYAIVQNDFVASSQKQKIKNLKRPIWFIYPGMGSQWPKMAKQLLEFDIFQKSISECHQILLQKDINLFEVLTNQDEAIFKNILNCFVGITAVMISLTDLLTSLGVEPDGFIGHSFGEICCAYSDKCLNKEEALLTAYYRGLTSIQNCSSTIKGMMAVVGLGGREALKKCPKSIEVVCYNGQNSCTIAGPVQEVQILIKKFKTENIFAAGIFSAEIAYHSSYIQPLGKIYRNHLTTVIRNPRLRSSKWISSSIPEETSELKKYCSAEYFENNFISTVRLDEALKHIPNNAVTIEISPHCILKTILNSSLNSTISNISLVNKNNLDQVKGLLLGLGRLYNENVDMDISKLYPPVLFPVSRGTPMISPLIKWNHEKDWYVPFETFNPKTSLVSGGNQLVINCNEKWRYLKGHVVDGRNLVPESVFLEIIIDLASRRNNDLSNTSCVFKHVNFFKHVEIPSNGSLSIDIILTRSNNYFEITLEDAVVTSGFVYLVQPFSEENAEDLKVTPTECGVLTINSDDLYKELKIKGYNYGKDFQTLIKCDLDGSLSLIKFIGNLAIDLNTIFQLLYLHQSSSESYYQISKIGFLRIDNFSDTEKKEKLIRLQVPSNKIVSKNLIVSDIEIKDIVREIPREPVLQSVEFVPYFPSEIMKIEKIVSIILSIILENNLSSRLNVHEFLDTENDFISLKIHEYFQALFFYKADITLHVKNDQITNKLKNSNYFHIVNENYDFQFEKNIHLLILTSYKNHAMMLNKCFSSLADGGFVVSRENLNETNVDNMVAGLEIVGEYNSNGEKLVLWHKLTNLHSLVEVNIDGTFEWINELQNVISSSSNKIILYSKQKQSGIMGFYNCVRKETPGKKFRCFLMMDPTIPDFNPKNPFYLRQLTSNLAVNVYQNGKWGCYVPFRINPESGAYKTTNLLCSPEECYIICGGLGGMGLELADWLVTKGVRKLVLVSRTGKCDGYKLRKISKWRLLGVKIIISKDNISSVHGVENLLRTANKLGNVAAIFNTALILHDNLFEKQTEDSFKLVANPKAVATSLLDSLSRSLCPRLKYFVVFSSITCGYGNAGQSNYGYANSVMERICELRRQEGLPALSVEWAGVGDVGYLEKNKMKTVNVGTSLQPIRSCLWVLEYLLNLPNSLIMSFVVATTDAEDTIRFASQFATIQKIIDKSDHQLQDEATLSEIGLDSIAIAEVKNILEHNFNIFMSGKEIMNLRVIDLWELERTSKLPTNCSQKSLKKLSMLQEIYTNLFQIIREEINSINLKPLIRLPSFLHDGATNIISTTDEKTIFFLPSVEGFASVMLPLAKNIDLQVLCGQYSLGQVSIKQIVNMLVQEIEKRLDVDQQFHILGYSYGGLIAMEITYALEKKGRTGCLYMIDSSPSTIKNISKELFRDENSRTNNLAFACALNCGIDIQKFENELLNCNSWSQMDEVTIEILPGSVIPNKDLLRTILTTLHDRIDDLELYNGLPKKSLISNVFLFKPIDLLFDEPVENDLSEYCCNPIQEFDIEGNHFNMIKSEKLAYYMRNLHKITKT